MSGGNKLSHFTFIIHAFIMYIRTLVTKRKVYFGLLADIRVLQYFFLVGALREPIGVHCAYLSTSVKFDTEVDQSILISFFEGAKAGAHWGRHIN